MDKDKAERLVSAYSVRECLGPFTAAGGLLDAYVTISTARRLLESASLESLQAQLKTLSNDASTQGQTLQAVRAKIAKTGTLAAELTELRGQEIKLQQLSDASALRIAELKECIIAKSSGRFKRGPTSKWPKWCCKSSCSQRGSNDALRSLDSGALSTTEEAQNIDDDAQRREHLSERI